ncbi:MAG TPA: hybrid sensor histidine kinase/response regulator [Verrucomicrobiota bacterium]|nr:hybrid sensor histidine kinase/response regulator [Verrucomicrobiota bacterium]HQL79445.1 hybrid sensor histidine kinase/response regulator [Verrucomicrobiota bacterium]
MQNLYDYKRFAVLYVDDEEMSLKYFTRAFQDQFRIFTAANAQDGLKLLEEHKDKIGVLMTDQRMPGEKGIWLLEKARQLRPRIIRILATAYSDMEVAIAAVNTGAIYKYVTKPWDVPQLENTLMRGLEFFMVQRERDQLLKEKMSVLHNRMIADRIVSLGLLAAGLSHHIRNSLVAVKTFLDLAPAKMEEEKVNLEGLRNPDFWKEYYQNVQGQIEKINDLLKDLWTASERPTFEFGSRVHLHEVAAAAITSLKDEFAAKNIAVENRIPASLPALSVDQPKFSRLFDLLLKDELVSLPGGNRVTLSARLLDAAKPDQQEVLVELSDDGPGLPKEALQLVFDPFVLRSDSPTEYGIHLMGCYFIVHHHGGWIDAVSEAGRGTTFRLRLPLDPSRAPPPQTEASFLQKVLLSETLWEKLISSE